MSGLLFTVLMAASVALTGAHEAGGPQRYWPQWRGPLGSGVAPHANPPVEWSESKNIRWKIALSGKGHSTPIVWGDRVFITTAVPYGEPLAPKYSDDPGAHDIQPVGRRHRFMVMAVRRDDGKVLWQRTVRGVSILESYAYTIIPEAPVEDSRPFLFTDLSDRYSQASSMVAELPCLTF